MSKARSAKRFKSTKLRKASGASFDLAILAALILAATLAGVSTLLLGVSAVHRLVVAGLVAGDLLGAAASLVYGMRHSRICLALAMSLAFLAAAAWQLLPEASKPRWTAIVPAALLILAVIPWVAVTWHSTEPNRK